MSDNLARLTTGDEVTRRKLFTDDGEVTFRLTGRIVATTIGLASVRGDLADRIVPVECLPIRGHHLNEDAARRRIDGVARATLGAMLDLAAGVLDRLPEVRGLELPRMARFGELLAAIDLVRGTETLSTFLSSRGRIATASLDADPFWWHLTRIVDERGGELVEPARTIGDMLRESLALDSAALRKAEGRFGPLYTPESTASWLKRLEGPARLIGWEFGRSRTGSSRYWTIRRPAEGRDQPSQASQPSTDEDAMPSGSDGGDGHDGGDRTRPRNRGADWVARMTHE